MAEWDVSTASYTNKYKDVSSQDTVPRDLTFSSDGTKMYIVGSDSDTVYQYTLSTAWDVSTASYTNKYKDVSSQDTVPRDLTFSSDGTKMYIVGSGSDTVYQYTLSTDWDISTATYADKSKGVSSQETTPTGVTFSSDGSKMYIVGYNSDTVYQYTLSTEWDISTATYDNKYKDISSQETGPTGVTFSSDGSKMYIVGYSSDTVYQYTLSTEWDISTATYDNKYKDISSQETAPTGVTFSSDGSKMYIVGTDSVTVYQYTLPIGQEEYNSILFGMNF